MDTYSIGHLYGEKGRTFYIAVEDRESDGKQAYGWKNWKLFVNYKPKE